MINIVKGIFISLEGIDGAGKTSLAEKIIKNINLYQVVSLREPGGTYISEKIRDLLLDVRNEGMLSRTEAMLYAAARSQVVEEVIMPALAKDKIVIADRYIDSTLAYQGYGRGLDMDFLKQLNYLCTGGLKPDLTLLLDIDPRAAQQRRKKDKADRMEKEGIDFQTAVREGYLKLACEEPGRIKVLDGASEIDLVFEQAWKQINALL